MKSLTSVWAGPIGTEPPNSRRGGKGSPMLYASAWRNELFIKQSAECLTPVLSSPIRNGYTSSASRLTKCPQAPSSSSVSRFKSHFWLTPLSSSKALPVSQRGFAKLHGPCPQHILRCRWPVIASLTAASAKLLAKIYLPGQKLVLLSWRYHSGHRYTTARRHAITR